MLTLTPELPQAIAEAGDEPARLVDPETNTTYVLVRAEDYERVKGLLDDEDDVRAMLPYIAKVFGPEGWDDPSMDIYDDLDPRRDP